MRKRNARKRSATAGWKRLSSVARLILKSVGVLVPALAVFRLLIQEEPVSLPWSTENLLLALRNSTAVFQLSSSNTTHNEPHKTYMELADLIQEQVNAPLPGGRQPANYETSYQRATVYERAPWFMPPRKLCKETCCVQGVAISLEQDETQLINTRDGMELADLVLPYQRVNMDQLPPRHQFTYFGRTFDKHMLPCLVPGTIIGVQNHLDLTVGFFHEYRPFIQVPYLLTVTGTDGDSPQLYEEYIADPLLIQYYATNPRYDRTHRLFRAHRRKKMHPMNLGLSYLHPQERFLEPYLQLNQYRNPFLLDDDKSKWDLAKHPFDFDKDVFVQFKFYPQRPHREALWNRLCSNNAIVNKGNISCTKGRTVGMHQFYKQMSQYRFGLSPPGVGYDCYRTYELLLLGVIPIIEERAPESHLMFEGLPVIQVANLSMATTISRQEIATIIQNYVTSPEFQNDTFEKGWKLLFLQYQRQAVLKDTKRDREILVDETTGKQYYQGYRYSLIGPGNNTRNDELRTVMRAKWFDHPEPKLNEAEKKWLQEWEQLGVKGLN
ncbi:expressed unknown protein [Seminavis robusta]|uniref:Uncharacterized protein n=1 Tax=Seminavis robusta TaxID=568900 RepID=A0A9N8DWV2_9STRA|nr:expressed unknown protein [Seminavis robusta]|eukprot:Sro405_g136190.1 n/a (551) ;mRNA; f:42301-44041